MIALWWAAALLAPAAPAEAPSLASRPSIAGAPSVRYSAAANYAVDATGRVRGKWIDSHGRTRPVAGGVSGATWWTQWGSADVEIGRSTYVLEEGGIVTVSDSVLQDDGSWRAFAVLRYRRTNGRKHGLRGTMNVAHKKRGPGLSSRPSLSGSPLLKLLTQ